MSVMTRLLMAVYFIVIIKAGSSGDLDLSQWLSWDIAKRESAPLPTSSALEIVSVLNDHDKSLFIKDIIRIDVVNIGSFRNQYVAGQPEKMRSRFNVTSKFYNYAWSSSGCGGLRDKSLAESNGFKQFKLIERDYLRLKKYGLISPGGVAIDIGAHVGDSTIPLSLLSNLTIAFDPSISVFPILNINAKINPHLNIHAFPTV